MEPQKKHFFMTKSTKKKSHDQIQSLPPSLQLQAPEIPPGGTSNVKTFCRSMACPPSCASSARRVDTTMAWRILRWPVGVVERWIKCPITWVVPPPRMPVTTRIITFLVGNPELNPLLLGGGTTQPITYKVGLAKWSFYMGVEPKNRGKFYPPKWILWK